MAKVLLGWALPWVAGGANSAVFLLAAGALVACGETTREPGDTLTSSAGVGGVPASAGAAGVGGTSSAGSGPVMVGAAGAPLDVGPPADIAGRWAMFNFEDPVGVRLVEGHDGVLTGRGCAAGAPDKSEGEVSLCGDIVGKVTGFSASFGFPLVGEPGGRGYSARVIVSRDARRMTGSFNNGLADLPTPTAWLRVPDGEVWLDRPAYDEKDPLAGAYELRLLSSSGVGDEYTAEQTYHLSYWRHGLSGSLGSFWGSEMSEPGEGSPVKVGPVAATAPELPTSMQLSFDAQGFTQVVAQTAVGSVYTFAATHVQ